MKVFYVMGYGRSGSTILDRMLGAYDDAVGCGELTNIAKSGWIDNEYCSCGSRVTTCDFWASVYEIWSRKSRSASPVEFHELIIKYESHSFFSQSVLFDRVPDDDYKCYLHDLELLYSSIKEVSGKNIVVDSSKNVARAYNLRHLSNVDVYYIHLTRDCRGVVNSMEKSFVKKVERGVAKDLGAKLWLRTVLAWSLYNYECELLKKYSSNKIFF